MPHGSPSTSRPRVAWKTWVGLTGAALACLVLGHYVWFTVFGPPARWGTGVVSVDPTIERGAAAEVEPLGGWALDAAATLSARLGAIALDGVEGTPFQLDVAADDGMAVLQTFAGASWTLGQRLYVRSGAAAPWRAVPVPRSLVLGDAGLVRPGGRPAVLVSAWQPWWPYERSYRRFFRSMFDQAHRPENALRLVDPASGEMRYLFPGEAPILSPDRRAVAYVTSENDHVGYHTIAVWTVGAPAPVPVLSLWETDPGSGRSFGYRWSESSAALRIEGATGGFARWGRARHQALRLTYLVGSHRLLEPAP